MEKMESILISFSQIWGWAGEGGYARRWAVAAKFICPPTFCIKPMALDWPRLGLVPLAADGIRGGGGTSVFPQAVFFSTHPDCFCCWCPDTAGMASWSTAELHVQSYLCGMNILLGLPISKTHTSLSNFCIQSHRVPGNAHTFLSLLVSLRTEMFWETGSFHSCLPQSMVLPWQLACSFSVQGWVDSGLRCKQGFSQHHLQV